MVAPPPPHRARRAGWAGCALLVVLALPALGERAAGRPTVRLPARVVIDPWTADEAALRLLPGIGAGRAAAILRARAEAPKPWRAPEDLAGIPGIGPVTIEALRRGRRSGDHGRGARPVRGPATRAVAFGPCPKTPFPRRSIRRPSCR